MKFDKINKNKIKKEMHLFNRFTTKLVSYSVIDKIYVAKYTDNPNIYPIANGLFNASLNKSISGSIAAIIPILLILYPLCNFYLNSSTFTFITN